MTCFNNAIMGHRGAAGLALENTLASIRAAKAAGAASVEFDVTLLGDDTVVVHHDDALGRVMQGESALKHMLVTDLPGIFPIGEVNASAELRIPSLEDVLALVDELRLGINIEIKNHGHDAKHLVSCVVECLRRRRNWNRSVLSSFDEDVLAEIKLQAPQWRRAWIVSELADNWLETARDLSLYSMNLHHSLITPEWIDCLRQEDLYTFVWTVNDTTTAQRLLQMGVDGIITDYPNRMMTLE